MYTGVDTAVQILCKYIHTSAHRHSYTKLSSYEGGLSGEVPLGRRRIHGHPPAQFGALVCNITRLCTNHPQKIFLTVGTNVYIYAHSCTKLTEKVLLTKTPTAPTLGDQDRCSSGQTTQVHQHVGWDGRGLHCHEQRYHRHH